MIEYKGGHYRSVRTAQEWDHILSRGVTFLSEQEELAILEFLDHPGFDEIVGALDKQEYDHPVVSIEEWLDDPFYSGPAGRELFKKWRGDIKEIFEGDYCEVILTGSQGCGKSFAGGLIGARSLYELSCLKRPQKSFNLAQGTWIDYVCVNWKIELARDVTLADIWQVLESAPYFREVFPARPNVSPQTGRTPSVVTFPKHIRLSVKTSTDRSLLGLAVYGINWDESNVIKDTSRKGAGSPTNSFANRKAGELYSMMRRRIEGRFLKRGRTAGKLVIISSKKTKSDFTEQRIRKAMDDPHVFVRDYAAYEVKPEEYSENKFRVLLGRGRVPCHILEEGETVDLSKYGEDDDAVVIDVPEDLRQAFEMDLFDAARDLAGYSLDAVTHFLRRRELIYKAVDDRVPRVAPDTWRFGDELRIDWSKLCRLNAAGDYSPIKSPQRLRHFHLDQSKNTCATGFAVGHECGRKQVQRVDATTGMTLTQYAPLIYLDLTLQVVPPDDGGDILLYELREALIYPFHLHGFSFKQGSLDGFQSLEPMQQLQARFIPMTLESTDKTMGPWETAKQAFYEGRVIMARNIPLIRELEGLEHDRVAGKVYHSEGGSKDVADAVACVIWTITKAFQAGGPVDYLGNESDEVSNGRIWTGAGMPGRRGNR